MKYTQGRHPNSIENLHTHGWKPGQSGNPAGRPASVGKIETLITAIEIHQSKICELQAELAEAHRLIKQLNEIPTEQTSLGQDKENEALKNKVARLEQDLAHAVKQQKFWNKQFQAESADREELARQLTEARQVIDRLREELTPHRKAQMDHIREKIDLENAGYARR